MFHFRKIAAHLISPVPICADVLVVGLILLWFTRRQKAGRMLALAGTLMLFLFGSPTISDLLLGPLEHRYPPIAWASASGSPASQPAAKYVVVLSGGVLPDPRLPATSQLGPDTVARLVEGIRLYRELAGCKLILSGGGLPSRNPAAKIMGQVAQAIGVSQQDIILETQSRDTADQARLVKPLVGQESFILVTEASHMPRAMALFRKQGMNPTAGPAGFQTLRNRGLTVDDLVPSSVGLVEAQRAVYEYLGITWEWLTGQI